MFAFLYIIEFRAFRIIMAWTSMSYSIRPDLFELMAALRKAVLGLL